MTGWKPPRPILMTVDPIGGVWTYAVDLCRELGQCEIALASMGRSLSRAERAQIQRLPGVELFESTFKLEWMADPWRDVAAAADWLSNLADRVGPSLIHLNQFSHGALAWDVPCLVVGHSCVYSWYEAVKGRQPEEGWQKYKRMVSRGLRGADRVTAPSGWMLSALKKTYGQFDAAEPISNGRNRFCFVPGLKAEFILTAGRLWDEAKNIAVLDTIAPNLRWPIFAAGEVDGPDGVRAGLQNLRLLGSLDAANLGYWMGRAEIFALPARYEPFGLTILEAALAGCALVLGDIPSLREIWQDTALFVAPDDANEIATVLAGLIADARLRQKMARRARLRALEFTPQRTARAHMALYCEMLSQPKSPARRRSRVVPGVESRPQP
jgi:glycogen synthase